MPIQSRVVTVVLWTLLAACTASAARGAEDLTGVVLDRETHGPIPLVEVRLDGAFARLTAADGTFRIGGVEPGRHVLAFGHISYEPRSIEIRWPRESPLRVMLVPSSFAMDEVVVRGEVADISFPVRSTALTGEAVRISAGNIANDPLRTLQSQPGVAMDGIDFNSRAAIRGGDPEEQRVYFDGYPMDHYAHHGGFAGLIYDDLLRETVLVPGGAPLRYQGSLSGTILMTPMDADTNRFFFRCDITSLAAAAARKISPTLRAVGSAKSSFFNLPVYQQVGVKSKSFRDLMGRVSIGSEKSSQLTTTVVAATDEEIGSPFSGVETSRRTRSLLAGATLEVPREHWTGRIRGYHSFFHSVDNVSSRGEDWEHRLQGTHLSMEVEARGGPLGALLSGEIGTLDYQGRGGRAADHPAGASFEGRVFLPFRSVLVAGAGVSREPWTEKAKPEAYGSLTLGLHRRWRLAFGYRRSHQTPFLFTEKRHFATIPIDPGDLMREYLPSWEAAESIEMDQRSAHGEVRLSECCSIEADAYTRRYRNLPTWEWVDPLAVARVASEGSGDGSGYEITVRRNRPGGFSFSASFSHTEIEKREGTLHLQRPGDFDLPQAWRLSASYPVLEGTTISVAWQDVSGRPYTPLHLDSGPPSDLEVNSLRLPRFQRLDMKIQHRHVGPRGEMTFFVDVLNVLDRDNLVSRSAIEILPGEYVPYRYWGTTFFPIVGVSAKW